MILWNIAAPSPHVFGTNYSIGQLHSADSPVSNHGRPQEAVLRAELTYSSPKAPLHVLHERCAWAAQVFTELQYQIQYLQLTTITFPIAACKPPKSLSSFQTVTSPLRKRSALLLDAPLPQRGAESSGHRAKRSSVG